MTLKRSLLLKKEQGGIIHRSFMENVSVSLLISSALYHCILNQKEVDVLCDFWLQEAFLCPSLVLNYSIAFINYSFC